MKNFKKIIPLALATGLILTACSSQNTNNTVTNVAVKEVKTISTEDFTKAISDASYQIVDTRDDSAFNGFTNGEITIGGHIKNAIQYSASFVGKVNQNKLDKYVTDKGLSKDKKIVLYDTNKDNLTKVADEFAKLGYEVLKYEDYKTFASTESNKDSIVAYDNFKNLVTPAWVNDLVLGKKPETYTNNDYKVFEVSWGEVDKAKSYNAGHIKGAYHFNTDWVEEGPIWNFLSTDKIKENLLKQGITSDTTVVLYSDDASAAHRVNLALKIVGVKDVRVMNGKLENFKSVGGQVETNVNTPEAKTEFGTVETNDKFLISRASEMAERIEKEGIQTLSIRSWEEFKGEKSGYDYIPKAGELKGAKFGFSGTDASNMDDYYDPDGTLRNPNEIYNLWSGQGIASDDKIALYCGTGWRNSIPWFMTQMTDRANTFFYDGGWNDWQMEENASLPVDVNKNLGTKPDAKNDYK